MKIEYNKKLMNINFKKFFFVICFFIPVISYATDTEEFFILVNNANDAEFVMFSFDRSTLQNISIIPGYCMKFAVETLPRLTIRTSTGMLEGGGVKVLCGAGHETQCTVGAYEVINTGVVFDSYNMQELEQLDETLKCFGVIP